MTLDDKSEFLDRDQVHRAVIALREYVAEQKKTNLVSAMDDVENFQLQFTFKKIPSGEQIIRVPIPHSLVRHNSDVCLIVKDLNRKDRDYQPTIKHYKKLLATNGIKSVSEIMPLKQIKLEYQPFEAKRNLSNMYDVYLADATVMRLLPEILGKAFYGRKRIPIQVHLNASNLKGEIDKALHTSQCPITGKGPSVMMKVAHSGLGVDESVDNIMAAAEKLGQSIPGGAINIRNMHLRTVESPALPIYISTDMEEGAIKLPHNNRKRKGFEMKPSEVSTVMDAKVQVTYRGKIRVIPNRKFEKIQEEKLQKELKKIERAQKASEKKENATKRSEQTENEKGSKMKGGEKKKVGKQQVKKEIQKLEEKEAEENTEELNGADNEAQEKENETTETRSNREEIDPELFSDTTADSELSETEEVALSGGKTRKHITETKKVGETNSKGGKEAKKKTVAKNIQANKTKAKTGKKVVNTKKATKAKSKNVKKVKRQ